MIASESVESGKNMLKSCHYCGRIHAKDYDCGKKPQRIRYSKDSNEAGRYSYTFTMKSREIKERSHHLCAVCLTEGKLTYDGLETHHITKLREAPDLLLEDGNLICLCQRHHEMADAGLISADELRRLAAQRDEGCPGGVSFPPSGCPETTLPPK